MVIQIFSSASAEFNCKFLLKKSIDTPHTVQFSSTKSKVKRRKTGLKR